MNTLVLKPLARSLSFSADIMTVDLVDGRSLNVPLVFFPRLNSATYDQLNRFEISGGGVGLHWDELDEDISVPFLLAGYVDSTSYTRLEAA